LGESPLRTSRYEKKEVSTAFEGVPPVLSSGERPWGKEHERAV